MVYITENKAKFNRLQLRGIFEIHFLSLSPDSLPQNHDRFHILQRANTAVLTVLQQVILVSVCFAAAQFLKQVSKMKNHSLLLPLTVFPKWSSCAFMVSRLFSLTLMVFYFFFFVLILAVGEGGFVRTFVCAA